MSKKRPRGNSTETRMVKALDELAAYEDFCDEILPALRQALKSGKSAEDIYKMTTAVAAARAATIAVKDPDSGKALAAIKEILDRSGGKPKERQEVEHKYAKLKEEELDSLILSELQAVTTEDDLPN